MELDAEQLPGEVLHGSGGAGITVCHRDKSLRQTINIVGMAHPGDPCLRQPLEKRGGGVKVGHRFPIFPGVGADDMPTQGIGHQLYPITDAQHWDSQGKNLRIYLGGGGFIDAVGAPCEDDTDGLFGRKFLQRGIVGEYLTIDSALPNPPGDQLVILPAKIQHEDCLMLHRLQTPFS